MGTGKSDLGGRAMTSFESWLYSRSNETEEQRKQRQERFLEKNKEWFGFLENEGNWKIGGEHGNLFVSPDGKHSIPRTPSTPTFPTYGKKKK